MSLVEQLSGGDPRALSKIVSAIEDETAGYEEVLARLYKSAGHALRVGVTGPPGAGKSTLVNLLAQEYLKDQKKIGIIAVDPTSPFTGGALLGDRVRMNEFPVESPVYFRSMATRGASGGLSAATGNVAIAYDAFGFDITMIETVGVGQVELDIVDACDVVIVVLVPESGDAVQTMKAGLMEIGDIFCINKSDRPGAERIAAELRMTLETRKREEGTWKSPIVATEAVNRKNIDRLYTHIADCVAFRKENHDFEKHRKDQVRKTILQLLKNRFEHEFVAQLTRQGTLDAEVSRVLNKEADPFSVSKRLFESWELSGKRN